jgi:hypothetical protein
MGGVMRTRIDDRLHASGVGTKVPRAPSVRLRLAAVTLVVPLAVISAAAGPQIAAAAATQTVTNCNNSGTGSLRQAVADAASGATIRFAHSLSCSAIILKTAIHLDRSVSIEGPGLSTLEMSGNNAVNIFDVPSGVTATIEGLTIANGGGNYNGGAIYSNGTLTVADSELSLNSAGGVGGAISNVGGVLNVTNTTFLANSSGGVGGGIFNDTSSTMTVSDSVLIYNNADTGGGILNEGMATIINSTLTDNDALVTNGGGILNYATLDVTDTTLWDNGAYDLGGGIFNGGSASLAGTIVAGSRLGRDCSGTVTDSGYNLDDDGSCGFSAADHSLSRVNPELGPLRDNGGPTETSAPAIGSRVLDQIPPTASGNDVTLCSGTDQRGVPRPQDRDCDIGAVEMECDVATVGTPFSLTVTTFGTPAPSLTEKGMLPGDLSFKDNGKGTATISGTPEHSGVFDFTVKAKFAKSATSRVVKQAFTLTVDPG